MLGYQLSKSNNIYSADGWFGLDFAVNFDIGVNWEAPLYNDNENLVFRVRPAAFVGGRQWVMFQIWYWKFWVFFDVMPVKMTFFDWYMMVNIVEYKDFCTAAMWELDITRFQLFLEVDVNECNWGLIGAFMTPS